MILYIDETHYYENVTTGPEFVGTGILIVEDEAHPKLVVDKALTDLACDPDIVSVTTERFDRRTLERQWFHACEDSKNAHSWLCQSINDSLVANFCYNYFPVGSDVEEALFQTFMYAGVQICAKPSPAILYIERRIGFTETVATRLVNKVFDAITWGAYNGYGMPAYFPAFKIIMVGKNNPGIQITDFLTWAVNRTRTIPPNKVWEQRRKFTSRSTAGGQNEYVDQGDYVLRGGIEHQLRSGIYPQAAFPLSEFSGNDAIVRLFCFILTSVRDFLAEKPASHVQHIHLHYKDLKNELEDSSIVFTVDLVGRVSSCFIRIFDMLPIYTAADLTNIPRFHDLLLAKRLAGLTLRKDLIHGIMTAQFLAKTLRNQLKLTGAP